MSTISIIFSVSFISVHLFQPVSMENEALIGLEVAESEYRIPQCVRVTSSGKLNFYLAGKNSKMVYFCPKTPQNYLLYPSENDICESEVTPRLRRATDEEYERSECPNRINEYTLYTYGYQIAYSENFEEKEGHGWDDWIEIYTFCFDHAENRILYFSYQIPSPTLLASKLFEEDRDHQYSDKNLNVDHFDDPVLEKYIQLILARYNKNDKCRYDTRQYQTLIMSHSDLALSVWKIPFFHLVNYGIFCQPLIVAQWVHINRFVRKLAVEGWGELRIKVGIVHHNNGNIHKIWWKLVITQDHTHAIAIILHNIPLSERPEPELGFNCVRSCHQYGFGKMIQPITEHLLYCCPPDVITNVMGLKSYETLDLKLEGNTILKPEPVDCDSDSKSMRKGMRNKAVKKL